ncbi:Type I restriction-modification system, restriction subunit R (plasmid) [Cyanobacterium sp. HL-69]|uniref:DEAD/DEAH box helicase n=1 Tax=Cyanobacterium sp. HL-69 TaxID=2054282 RepID=UPI000CA311C6|nr:Type I restriction-modification system, restriction subunit R [Cyanobacterium sp. HL-69]
MKIYDLLLNSKQNKLEYLLSIPIFNLLKLSDKNLTNEEQLIEALLTLYTPEELLRSKYHRDLIIEFLTPEQANILATVWDAPHDKDVYKRLKKVAIKQNSEAEKYLFNFFEIPVYRQTNITVEKSSFVEISPQYPLFNHQRNAAQRVQKYLYDPPYRGLLHMPTGAGKTRTAMNIIADHLRNNEPTLVVWLAYSEELCEQAVNEFEKAWGYLGDRPLTVYRFWGEHDLAIEEVNDGFVVAGLSKTYNALKKSIRFINQLGVRTSFVIIDEAHQAIAHTYKLVLDSLVIPYEKTALLGLTATPGRTWAEIDQDAQLANFFAQQKVTLEIEGYDNPVDYLVEQQYLAQAIHRPLFYDSVLTLTPKDIRRINQDLDIPPYILHRLEEDEQRNLRIILELEALTHRHHRIIVFAISVNHAQILTAVLKLRGYSAIALTGKTPKPEREAIIKSFKDDNPEPQILCNYGVLTTGFDAPKTSAAVIARPTKSLVLYSQMVGRAIRGLKAGGNATAEIITVVDSQMPGFGSVSDAFNNWEDVWRKN